MHQPKDIYTTAFNTYRELGLDPLPIPHQNGNPTKGPTGPDWPIKAANRTYTESDFQEQPCNIGILLGGIKNLTDIDCDSPEAIKVADEIMDHFMKRVGKAMMFGRASKPRSHYIFECDNSLPSEKIKDPAPLPKV